MNCHVSTVVMMKRASISLGVALGLMSLTACSGVSHLPGSSGSRAAAVSNWKAGELPVADMALSEVLPRGNQSIEITQRSSSTEIQLTGFVNLDDCSTSMTGKISSANDGPHTVEVVQAGHGDEFIRVGDGAWVSSADPNEPVHAMLEFPAAALFTYSGLEQRGVACSVNLLPRMTTIGGTAGDGTATLRWQPKTLDETYRAAAGAWIERYLKAHNVTGRVRDVTAQRYADVVGGWAPGEGSPVFPETVTVTVSKRGESTMIRTFSGVNLIVEYKLTPAAEQRISSPSMPDYFALMASKKSTVAGSKDPGDIPTR